MVLLTYIEVFRKVLSYQFIQLGFATWTDLSYWSKPKQDFYVIIINKN